MGIPIQLIALTISFNSGQGFTVKPTPNTQVNKWDLSGVSKGRELMEYLVKNYSSSKQPPFTRIGSHPTPMDLDYGKTRGVTAYTLAGNLMQFQPKMDDAVYVKSGNANLFRPVGMTPDRKTVFTYFNNTANDSVLLNLGIILSQERGGQQYSTPIVIDPGETGDGGGGDDSWPPPPPPP